MYRKEVYLALGLVIFLIFEAACADETARRIEEETRDALRSSEYRVSESKQRLVFDYGGWQNIRYINYHNDDKDSSTPDSVDDTLWFDSRLWLKATLKPELNAASENEHSLYIRLKNLYSESRPKETAGGSDNDGPHIDYAYATLDARPWWIKVGRQYFTVGQGLAYSDVDDGLEVSVFLPHSSLKAFFSRTLPHKENIDISVPGYDKESKRNFFGFECSYEGFTRQRLYGYAVVQRDYSKARPEDSFHDYTYDSEYFGLGSRGTIKPKVSYWCEIIRETGESIVFDTNEKKDVSAWAGVFAVAYEPAVYAQPMIYFKYAYGSGDKDRVSVTDTQGGNLSGKDKNFLYFGFIPAGYALAAQLSNLYFFKTGFSCKPLEKFNFFRNLTVALDFYKFYKDKSSAGMYDPQAAAQARDVGEEIDASITWQALSDLYFSLQYGYFMPASAYPDTSDTSETYLSISTSVSF